MHDDDYGERPRLRIGPSRATRRIRLKQGHVELLRTLASLKEDEVYTEPSDYTRKLVTLGFAELVEEDGYRTGAVATEEGVAWLDEHEGTNE